MRSAPYLLALVVCGACGPPPPPADPIQAPPPDAAPPPPPEVRREMPVGASPMSLVASGDALVWTDATGAIWTMPKAGGEPRQLSDQHKPGFAFQLFLAGERIRATSRGDVLDVDLASGRVTKLNLALPEYPEASVADAEYMYLTLFKRDQIVRVPVTPTAGGPVHTLAELPRSILARHRSTLYAASYATGVLLAIPTRGGAQRVVARGLPRLTAMVADADHAYAFSERDKALLKIRLADGTVSTLARDLVNSDTLVLDGGYVYTRSWGKARSVVRVAVDGSRPPEVLADGLATPYRIAVDDRAIYATLRDGARILAVPRSTLAPR